MQHMPEGSAQNEVCGPPRALTTVGVDVGGVVKSALNGGSGLKMGAGSTILRRARRPCPTELNRRVDYPAVGDCARPLGLTPQRPRKPMPGSVTAHCTDETAFLATFGPGAAGAECGQESCYIGAPRPTRALSGFPRLLGGQAKRAGAIRHGGAVNSAVQLRGAGPLRGRTKTPCRRVEPAGSLPSRRETVAILQNSTRPDPQV